MLMSEVPFFSYVSIILVMNHTLKLLYRYFYILMFNFEKKYVQFINVSDKIKRKKILNLKKKKLVIKFL